MWWNRQASELHYRRVGMEGHGAGTESLEAPLHHPADGHAVLGVLDPRHPADQERLEPPGVQLPALPLPCVVVPARTTALGTGQLRSGTPPHTHPQFLAVSSHVQLLDHPVRPEIEHGSQARSSRPRIRTATADSLPRSWGRACSRAN